MGEYLHLIPFEIWRQYIVLQYLDIESILYIYSANTYYRDEIPKIFTKPYLDKEVLFTRKDTLRLYRLSQHLTSHQLSDNALGKDCNQLLVNTIRRILLQLQDYIDKLRIKGHPNMSLFIDLPHNQRFHLTHSCNLLSDIDSSGWICINGGSCPLNITQFISILLSSYFPNSCSNITLTKTETGFIHKITFSNIYEFCDIGDSFLEDFFPSWNLVNI